MVAFNDRRPGGGKRDVPTSASSVQPLAKDARRDAKRKHQARPNDEPDRPDDETSPGYRCKDCNRRVTWMGPGMSDWVHA